MRGDAPCHLERVLEHFSSLAKSVDDTPGEGFLGGEGTRGKDQLFRAPLADRARQRLRSAPAWHDAERYFGKRELRCSRRVGKIAMQNELEAARISCAVDGGYHRKRALVHQGEHPLENLMLIEPLLVGERAPLLEIRPSAEGPLAGAGEHDAA